MRPAYQIVTDALMQGHEIPMPVGKDGIEHTWVMRQTESGSWLLLVKMWNETKNEPHYVNPGISFSDYLDVCNKLSEERLMIIGANKVLNDIKGDHYGNRG